MRTVDYLETRPEFDTTRPKPFPGVMRIYIKVLIYALNTAFLAYHIYIPNLSRRNP